MGRDAVVLFTADHGGFAGQYGLHEKWDTCMADRLLRVPCIVRAPGLPSGLRHGGLPSHVDLVPALLALLGLCPGWGLHGEYLVPHVRRRTGHAHVIAGGGHEREMRPRFNFEPKAGGPLDGKQRTYRDHPEAMARTRMARAERWKLVVRLAGGNELYDLAADPCELDNLWAERNERPGLAAVVAELQLAMLEHGLRTDTDRPYQEKVGA